MGNSLINISNMTDLQQNFGKYTQAYLQSRMSNNPEFEAQFKKTFGDLIFSQSEEMQEKLVKTRPNYLFNAVFMATEIGASFAKKEAYLIPYAIKKKETKNGVERTIDTGEYSALLVIDINFQKQQILRMENCKRFFTAEIHEGVEVLHDLSTGLYVFDGKNDVTKPTIGYYASFTTVDGEVYDLFMSNAEIVKRAKFSPQFKADNYKSEKSNIHYEKIVIRNLLKSIPRLTKQLINVLAVDERFTEYEDVTVTNTNIIEEKKPQNALEEAKANIAANSTKSTKKAAKKSPDAVIEPAKNKPETPKSETAKKVESFF